MAEGVITLAEMRAKGMTMLEAEHGAGALDLPAGIAADCPRTRNPSASIYERYGRAPSCRAGSDAVVIRPLKPSAVKFSLAMEEARREDQNSLTPLRWPAAALWRSRVSGKPGNRRPAS